MIKALLITVLTFLTSVSLADVVSDAFSLKLVEAAKNARRMMLNMMGPIFL